MFAGIGKNAYICNVITNAFDHENPGKGAQVAPETD